MSESPRPPRIQLVTRGDDAGSCDAADRAIVDACVNGLLRNVSIMAVGPSFASAARRLSRLPGVCLGLHVTLNSEWDEHRWGPVLPASTVPSLVDAAGCFLQSPRDLAERGYDVDEVEAEARAQLHRCREAGLDVRYVDEHMGVGWLPGVRERLMRVAADAGLLYAEGVKTLPALKPPTGRSPAEAILDRIAAAAPGRYVLVTHPGYADDGDMTRLGNSGVSAAEVARSRDEDRRLLVDPVFRTACQTHGVDVVRYSDPVLA